MKQVEAQNEIGFSGSDKSLCQWATLPSLIYLHKYNISMVSIQPLDKQIFLEWYMKRQYLYYAILFFSSFFLLLITILGLFYFDTLVVLLPLLVLFTIFRMQIAFIWHDLTHNQVFKSQKLNAFFWYIVWGLLSWLSQWFWKDKHNRHHEHTNQWGKDPDLDIPFAFLNEHSFSEKWIFKKIIFPFQPILFFVALPFAYLDFITRSFTYIFRTKDIGAWIDLVCMILNYIAVITILVGSQWLGQGIIFFIIHLFIAGLYMSIVFAPNHLWMETISAGEQYERIYQIQTSRNIKTGFLGNILLGGLDYQIEHHLYPTMPRKHYPMIAPEVRNFCRENNIAYTQTTLLQSFRDIYQALKKFSHV